MTNEEAIKNDEKYLFDEMMDLIKDEFDERDEAYNLGVYACIDILTKFNFNNITSVLSDCEKEKDIQHTLIIEWSNLYNIKLKENTKLKSENEKLNKYNSELCMELTITMDKLCLAEKEVERLRNGK